jgi:uncharacterized protein YaiE (UPF0345 family)
MPKTKISEYDATAANNTDVNSINIAEGCAPSGINNAIRQVMADLKDFQQGTKADPFLGPVTPSTLTLTSLAANRILYTNGSKVVSTSDNVQFDGTTVTINSLATTTFSASGVATFAAGSAGAPAITFAGDTNTGIYSPTADTIAFTEGGVEAMRINSSANVGVGTNNPIYKLDVTGTDGNVFRTQFNSIGLVNFIGTDAGYTGTSTNHPLAFVTNGSERMRIDAAGNVGLSVAPAPWASVKAFQYFNGSAWGVGTNDSGLAQNAYFDGAWKYISSSAAATLYAMSAGQFTFSTAASGTAGNAITWLERMRIDSSGVFYVNATTNNFFSTSNSSFMAQGGATGQISGVSGAATNSGTVAFWKRINGAGNFHVFYVGGASPTDVGSISTNGTTTAYTTTSDYRLKENIAPMTGALATVSALKPVTYKWKSTGETSQGFIAHELQAVAPDCVTGEKDAVDAEGKPVYQSIDTSFLVATLTAAIQEQQSMIESLTSRLNALEGK